MVWYNNLSCTWYGIIFHFCFSLYFKFFSEPVQEWNIPSHSNKLAIYSNYCFSFENGRNRSFFWVNRISRQICSKSVSFCIIKSIMFQTVCLGHLDQIRSMWGTGIVIILCLVSAYASFLHFFFIKTEQIGTNLVRNVTWVFPNI